MESLKSFQVQRFKRIVSAEIELGKVTTLVGSNNSGKTTIIQAMHFGISILQSVSLLGGWKSKETKTSTSLGPHQLVYSPSDDVYALAPGGKLPEAADQGMTFTYNLSSGEKVEIIIRKGKNRNIAVSIDNNAAAKKLASLENPFSIFSPGLAGIAKRENHASNGVLLRALARGDANMYLRNILYRLHGINRGWENLLNDISAIFPGVDVRVSFQEETSEFISVEIKSRETHYTWTPLELAGTGLLQCLQILSYIHRFNPNIIVLDEPDSHLHPNNQRFLCSLFQRIADEHGTQVLLTTHSRHVVDTIAAGSTFLWVREGGVYPTVLEDEIPILVDLGALDIYERVSKTQVNAIILTEDSLLGPLQLVLESSGFDLKKCVIMSYHGSTVTKNLIPLVRTLSAAAPRAAIIVHRDRDFLTDDEVTDWETEVRKLNVNPFVTSGRDIESFFINADYLASNPPLTSLEFKRAIAEMLIAEKNSMITDYTNGRVDALRKNRKDVNYGKLAVEAHSQIEAHPMRYAGKPQLRALRNMYRERAGVNLKTDYPSPYLAVGILSAIASKAFKIGTAPRSIQKDEISSTRPIRDRRNKS